MSLLATFLVFFFGGQALNFFIAVQIERHVSEAAGVLAFFVLLPTVCILGWLTAVRLTEPAAGTAAGQPR